MSAPPSAFLKNGRKCAFTLIELLVSFAIFFLLLLTLISLMSNTALVSNAFQSRMERSAELRRALDSLSADFRTSIMRDDLAPAFIKSPGNDEIYFHASADGYGGGRGITFIGYRIRNGRLERGAQGTDWTSNAISFSTNLNSANFIIDPENSSYDVLGQRIFRMETEYLLQNGTFSTNLSSGSWKDVAAIVINLATIDQRSLKKSNATLEQLAALFPDAEPEDRIITQWSQLLMDSEFFEGEDAEARKGIQLRQRQFPINGE